MSETTTTETLRETIAAALHEYWSALPMHELRAAAGVALRTLEHSEVMVDVEDALGYVIETSEHDTTRFRRAHDVLFPNTPKGTEDD